MADGTTRFHPAPPPTDRDVARLLATIRTHILRLLRRRGVLAADGTEDVEADPLAVDTPVLAQLTAAAVRGRSAIGDRAGTPVLRVGHAPDAPWVWTVGPRHAYLERFDLHADRNVEGTDPYGNLTVMWKPEDATAVLETGWLWVSFASDGTFTKAQDDEGCAACHSPGVDWRRMKTDVPSRG